MSAVWPQPSWQADSLVPGMDAGKVIKAAEKFAGTDFCQAGAVHRTCREVPDVSANADEYTGITIDYDGQWATIGGTSSSAPLWAAMLADIDSTPACGAHGVGFASPALYAVASVPAEYKASFNDITGGSNDEFGLSGLYPATRGYDMATGLGSPRVTAPGGGRGLAYYLCTPPATARPTVSTISPQVISSAAGTGTGPAGDPVKLTITGSHFESSTGAPDVAGITVGTYQVTPFTVVNASIITATLPAAVTGEGNGGPGDGAGVFDVAVTLTGGLSSTPTSAARLTVYHDPSHSGASVPVVDAVTPSGGNEAGGTVMHIYGSGFTAQDLTSTVTVGGVSAQVKSATDTELTVVVPPYGPTGGSATTCAAFDAHPTTDVCQTQVQVTNINGSSVEAPILPEYSGYLGEPVTGTETVAARTEFDYLPTPKVTGYTFVDPAQSYASEEGFSYITNAENEVIVTGTGLGPLGFEWADVGRPGTATAADDEVLQDTSTSVDLYLPDITLTDHPMIEPLAVQTLASPNQANLSSSQEPSTTLPVTYAPVPKLRSISTPSGKDLGPSAGGTRITVKGAGFYDGPLVTFTNYDSFSIGTEYDLVFSKRSPHTEFSVVTTGQLPGETFMSVCTVSGCSGDQETCVPGICVVTATSAGHPTFAFYPPGRPSLRSVNPTKGRADRLVTIRGTNLDLPQAVYFGSVKLRTGDFGNGYNYQTGASDPNVVLAIVPRGLPLGRKVDIRVVTAESEATERHPETPVNKNATFTLTHRYRPSRP